MADCDAVVVLWSEPASRSRWCAAEILAAHHLARGIVVGDVDGTARPPLLSGQVTASVRSDGPAGIAAHVQLVSPGTYEPPSSGRVLDPEMRDVHDQIGAAQFAVLAAADVDLSDARRRNAKLTDQIMGLAERFTGEPVVWTLLGYQLKNTYQLAWWEQQGAPRPPADPTLLQAEQWFFRSLFVDPDDFEALNGLASVLITEREAEAASFFLDRVFAIATAQRIFYPAAAQDRLFVQRLLHDRIGLRRQLQPQRGHRRRTRRGVLLVGAADASRVASSALDERLVAEHLDVLWPGTATSSLGAMPVSCADARAAVTVWSASAPGDADLLTRLLVALHEGCRVVLLRLDSAPLPDLLAGVLAVDLASGRPEELDKLVRTLRHPPRARQVLMTASDWEPEDLRRVGDRAGKTAATADGRTRARLVRQAEAAAARWPGYPGAHRYVASTHLAAARSVTTGQRGLAARRRHLEQARLAALRALLLDPTDAPSLAVLGELSTLLELPLADYFTTLARHHAARRGEEVG
jgi:hypothetical protein